jgi:anti-anti-sigma factor
MKIDKFEFILSKKIMEKKMELNFSKTDNIDLIKISGRIDSITSGDLQTQLIAYLTNGAKRLAIDFSDVNYISSAGLRAILVIAKEIKKTDGGLVIYSMQNSIKDVFDMSGFSSIINIVSDFDTAKVRL